MFFIVPPLSGSNPPLSTTSLHLYGYFNTFLGIIQVYLETKKGKSLSRDLPYQHLEHFFKTEPKNTISSLKYCIFSSSTLVPY